MQPDPDKVRKSLGTLAAMAAQCDEAERQILARATARLADVDRQMDAARTAALTGGDAEQEAYEALVNERGVLNQVIAQAKQTLART